MGNFVTPQKILAVQNFVGIFQKFLDFFSSNSEKNIIFRNRFSRKILLNDYDLSFRYIKAFMHAFSGRFSRTCLEGISFKFFVCFIFNVSLGSAPKRKNFDIQRNTRVGSGGQFTSNRLSCHHILFQKCQIRIRSR